MSQPSTSTTLQGQPQPTTHTDTQAWPAGELIEAPRAEFPVPTGFAPVLAGRVMSAMQESGFFNVPLSEELRTHLELNGKPENISTGVGCVTTDMVSFGPTLETLGMYARGVLFNRIVREVYGGEAPGIVYLVGDAIALNNQSVKGQEEEIRAVGAEHQAIAEKMARLTPDVPHVVVRDSQFVDSPEYQAILRERKGMAMNSGLPEYSVAQDAVFRFLQVQYGASVKGGWTTMESPSELPAAAERFTTKNAGGCERVFDHFSAQAFPGMGYFYGPPAITWEKSQPTACPYTSAVVRRDGDFWTKAGYPRESVASDAPFVETMKYPSAFVEREQHGRILLRRDFDIDAAIPDIRATRRNAEGEVRVYDADEQRHFAAAALSVHSLMELLDTVLPAMPGRPTFLPTCLEEKEALTSAKEKYDMLKVMPGGKKEKEALNKAYIEMGAAARDVIVKQLPFVIDYFATRMSGESLQRIREYSAAA